MVEASCDGISGDAAVLCGVEGGRDRVGRQEEEDRRKELKGELSDSEDLPPTLMVERSFHGQGVVSAAIFSTPLDVSSLPGGTHAVCSALSDFNSAYSRELAVLPNWSEVRGFR